MSTRVAILSPCFWPEVRRGAERIVRELADELIARGHEPRLITSHRGLPSRTVEDGLPIVRNWRPPDGRLERRMFEHHLTHVPLSFRSLMRGNDQIAQAVYPTDALAALRWKARTGRPVILSYMGVPDRPGLVWRRRRIEITVKAMRGADAVVVLSHTAAAAAERWLGVEARVIHPGVDLEAFRRTGPRSEEPRVFCAADAGEPRKRVDLLVEAMEIVRRSRPTARLELVRPGDRGLAARLESAGAMLLDPVSDPAALAPAYSRAWVSALPSIGDSFGIVLAESLACGTPVVGSNRDAIPEVVDRPEIGRLFDGGADELARALLEAFELSEDPATVPACRIRAEDFSKARVADGYEALYAELL